MRVNQKFCDFYLDANGEVICVHKLALAVASDYFAAMFKSDMKETREGNVKFEEVDAIAVKALVSYVYSRIITFTENNVEAIWSALDLFQFVWVKEQCEEFLKLSLSNKNCFRMRRLADVRSCQMLYDLSHKYIMDHFDDLIHEKDLFLLPFEEIRELVKKAQHSVKFADNVYRASMNWVKHDLQKKKS
uniref:BTB domain-containing protein n=1 Tax=Glossina brevipalpis TaxID=37001 RepID=A0A1A9WWQ3_9MUSC